MTAVERFVARVLFAPVAAARPYLVLKGTLAVLAFDLWLTRLAHAGRYGAGGFNVAHFAWLDAVQPPVTPALYIGLTTLTGLLSFVLAIAPRPPRSLLALTFVLHTWGWAMAMLDSYQHHYLLSIILLALVFFPKLTADEAFDEPSGAKEPKEKPKKARKTNAPDPAPAQPMLTSAWAYVVLAASIAIVYAYAAFSKASDEWLSGVALRGVLGLSPDRSVRPGAEDPFGALRTLAALFGFGGERFFWLVGHSVVLVQIVCAAGYLLAPFRDVTRSHAMRAFSWVALVTAVSFHVGAELMRLKIGWFSWYMILYALVYLLPAQVLVPVRGARSVELWVVRGIGTLLVLAGALGRSAPIALLGVSVVALSSVRWLAKLGHDARARIPELPTIATIGIAAIGAAASIAAGIAIDLPGTLGAGVAGAALLAAGSVVLVVRRDARSILPYGVGAALGALSLFVAVRFSDVRFDFYRNVGGDAQRRGDLVAAYEAYVKANEYAPEGVSRERKVRALRRELARRGLLPPD